MRFSVDLEDFSTSQFEARTDFISEFSLDLFRELFLPFAESLDLFVVSSILKSDQYSEVISELLSAGASLGSHGHSHVRMDKISISDLDYEFSMSKDLLENTFNREVSVFRPPGFLLNNAALRSCEKHHYKSIDGYHRLKFRGKIQKSGLRLQAPPNICGLPIGGGYLRRLYMASPIVAEKIAKNRGFYLHPWELIESQKLLKLGVNWGKKSYKLRGCGPQYSKFLAGMLERNNGA